MKYVHLENNKILGWYDKEIHTLIPTPNIEVSDEAWQNAINNGHNKVNADGTTELCDFRTEDEKAKQELEAKISEAKEYLTETDWVEPYLIKHYTGLSILEEDSNKFVIEAKREEAKAFLNEQGL